MKSNYSWLDADYLVLLPVAILLGSCAPDIETTPVTTLDDPHWLVQPSGTTQRFQAISIVDRSTVWVSGTGGTYSYTTNGGADWHTSVVTDATTLQFRDVYAVSAQTAFLLSAGTGADSRVYKTVNAGKHWTLLYTNHEPEGFFDCMDFWDSDRGLIYGDSILGQLFLLYTEDGGLNWQRISPSVLPQALPDEGGFAASGTCLITQGEGNAWIGTGASAVAARVLRTSDYGQSWSVSSTPVVSDSNTAGIFSIALLDPQHLAVLGGDLSKPTQHSDNVAVTKDGGLSWKLAGRPVLVGSVYGASYVPGAATPTLVVVGPTGSDFSTDNGESWTHIDSLDYWAVSFLDPHTGWAVGPEGRIAKITAGKSQIP